MTDLKNKISKLFPEIVNADINQALAAVPSMYKDGNGNAFPFEWYGTETEDKKTVNLISSLSRKWVSDIEKSYGILDPNMFITTEQVNMTAGNPVINVERIQAMGEVKTGGHDFNSSKMEVAVEQIRLNRYHLTFALYDTDIMYGYGMDNKIKSAVDSVLKSVAQDYINTASKGCAEGGIKFGDRADVAGLSGELSVPDTLYLSAKAYAHLLQDATGVVGKDELAESLGWRKIVRIPKGYDFGYLNSYFDGKEVGGFGIGKDRVIGATGYNSFEAIRSYAGNSVAVRDLGVICGVPFVGIFSFDASAMSIKCTVQTWVGFTLTNSQTDDRGGVAFGLTDSKVKQVEIVNTASNPVKTKAVS